LKSIPEIAELSIQELCTIIIETEQYPCPKGTAQMIAAKVFKKDNPIDVEIVRLGKLCAYELARRFVSKSKPRYMIIKYWRKDPQRDYKSTIAYTYYDKLRAVDQMGYFDAQLPFQKEDIYYVLAETFDFCQKWRKIQTVSKQEPLKTTIK